MKKRRHLANLLLLCSAVFVITSCKDSTTIWSKDVESPDHRWISSAKTEQYAGLGTAVVITSAYLRQAKNSQRSVEILSLSNASAYPAGITSVEMTWATPTQLQLAYKGDAVVDFQAVRYAGIEIIVEH